ncbi:hypothetical protein BX600DRAFT_489382 [Xylariales sp. PMI_506]|nr:hypothetical protein BX600DRAFT_489382 [Xylariales sp. PMI_506]
MSLSNHLKKSCIAAPNETQALTGMIWLLGYAAIDKDTHKAVKEARRLLNVAEDAWEARKDVFELCRAAYERNEVMDPESKHWIKELIRNLVNAGHGSLYGPTIEKYIAARTKIDELKTQYNNNLRQESGGLWIDEHLLEGVPSDKVESWKLGEGSTAGKRFVPFANGGYKAVLTYAQSPATREMMYLAEEAKVPQNIDLFRDVMCLRDSQARLLGFSNHGEVMALDAVLDEQKILEFFPLEPTITAMLGLFWSLLTLRFVLIPSEELDNRYIWHDSVQVWEVWDDTCAEFLGFLYFDLFWRENKYQGSQNVNIQCGYLKEDGTRQVPATVLMCSFPTSTISSYALLKHGEVVTLFHELGHGIHDLVSKTKHVQFHGTRLPVDMVETPSLLLENWCWDKGVLRELSCHYTTLGPQYLSEWQKQNPGLPNTVSEMSNEMLDSIVKSRNMNKGLYYLHQLPETHQDIGNYDFGKLWYDLREVFEGISFSKSSSRGHEYATFGHLLSGDDVDIFRSLFAKEPASAGACKRYKQVLLEPGVSQEDQINMITQLLGREPNYAMFAESLKISE